MTVSSDHDTRMVTALVQLRGALQDTRLPLEVADVEELRTTRQAIIDQIEDYVLPRQMSTEAPVLAVVGGSTGAGKSTLVNTLVGRRVTAPGLLRPTTRTPVLVHHPDDAHWFGQERLLPHLARVDHATDAPDTLQLVASETVPAGLAVLDAPDVDSVEERNRTLAAHLLAAGDLWLFVTSAARYSDQVPWEYLKQAAERSTAVAVVLDRTPADAVQTVSAHLARMLASRGLKDSPLFTVNESEVSEDGLLPAAEVADIRGWLVSLASDTEARSVVVKQTLEGTIRALAREGHRIADGAAEQLVAVDELRDATATAYDEAVARTVAETSDGTVVRGEVLARWQELLGTGALLRSLEGDVGRLRNRVVNAVRGTPQPAEQVSVAIGSGLELVVLEHAEEAAVATWDAWAATEPGRALLAGTDPGLGRASPDARRRAEREVRLWQEEVLELVRAAGAERRTSARYLALGAQGLGVALMVVTLARQPSDPGSAAATSAAPGRKLLEAVLGAEAVGPLVARAGSSLQGRLAAVLEEERRRSLAVLDELGATSDTVEQLRAAARRVDDRRFEQARAEAEQPG